jgi:hypothetical protein
MAKSRKSRRSVMKTISTTADKALPVVDKGLKTVGTTAKNVADASIPVIEKGVSVVYGTMATGLDLGVKGAKTIAKGVSKTRRSRSRHISRGRKMAGGRRTRRRHSRRH